MSAYGEADHTIHALEWLDMSERAIAIVSQDYWLTLRHAQYDVQISVQIEVDRPRSGVRSIDDFRGQFGFRCHINEVLRGVLLINSDSVRRREYQIGFEIVVQIGAQNRVAPQSRAWIDLAPAEAAASAHLLYERTVVSAHTIREPPSPSSGSDPIQVMFCAVTAFNGCSFKLKLHVRRGRVRVRRRQLQKLQERLSHRSGGSFHLI